MTYDERLQEFRAGLRALELSTGIVLQASFSFTLNGYTINGPATIEPISVPGWTPKEEKDKEHGSVNA